MKNQNSKPLIICLLLQIILIMSYGYAVFFLLSDRPNKEEFIRLISSYVPLFFIFVLSLLPQFTLLLNRKLHSQDGEIFPFLFTIVSLQSSQIIGEVFNKLNIGVIYPDIIIYIERFSLLGSAILFLLSALRYNGFSSSKMPLYTVIALLASLLMSLIAPISTGKGNTGFLSTSYDAYFQVLIITIYAATIVTFLVMAINDNSSLSIKRAISFICLVLGLYISQFNAVITAIFSLLFYLVGSILLTRTAGDSL